MINGHMKMFDIAHDNPLVLLVLEHFNIPLGFADQTIAQLCQQHEISERLFLTFANLFCCRNDVILQHDHFDATDAGQILEFLKTSHRYFLDEKIPKLKAIIGEKMSASPDDKYSKLIKKFILDYADEVFEHINYENKIVFPYVEALLQKKQLQAAYHIDEFKKHHSNIEDKLIDLKNLLLKYVPPDYDSSIRRQMLFELYALEHDINIHDFIENHLLIPLVQRLEIEHKTK